jgi:signal peptidase I
VFRTALHAIVLFFALTLLFDERARHMKPFTMLSNGMAPTIKANDMVMAENGSLDERRPGRGDIVVFLTKDLPRLKAAGQSYLIQRIAALEGDKVEFQPDSVLVNGVEFVTKNEFGSLHHDGTEHRGLPASVVVPPGHVFTLGDRPDESNDGRFWGFVPEKNIIYRAWFCYWPPNRVGPVR